MFKQAIIYYPKDEKIMNQINKDIAAAHCAAAVKYMDEVLKLTDKQKITLLTRVAEDIATNCT